MKQMLAAALRRDHDGVDSAYTVGMQHAQGDAALERILRYNHALSSFQLGPDDEAASCAFQLVMDCCEHLGLDIEDVFRTTPEHIRAAAAVTPDR